MSPNISKVFKWEVRKNIKSPTFLILTFLVPLIMLIGMGISFLITEIASADEKNIAVIDETEIVFEDLSKELASTNLVISKHLSEERPSLEKKISDGEYEGLLIITDEAYQEGEIPYIVRDAREHHPLLLHDKLNAVIVNQRLQSEGFSAEEATGLITPVRMKTRSIAGEEPSLMSFLAPFMFGMVLIFSAMFSGQVMMYGVIKEKRNRIVEILLSSITSLELMLGKILGFGLLGLIQLSIWLSVGIIVGGRFINLRQLAITPGDLLPSILFFLGGYLLFSAMYATLGATMKDAESSSQMQGLVILIPILPLFVSGAILMNPNIFWIKVISYIPPFIPVTMLLRTAATTIPWWEIATTFIVLLVSIWVTIKLGARIFDRGLLLFEKNLSFKEIRAMLKK